MPDPLSAFFLVCFLFGGVLTLLSLVTGMAHLSLPGGHGIHIGHIGHVAHLHLGHQAGAREAASPVNVGSLLAFLAWFGGVGYLLHTFSALALLLVLLLSLIAGLAGGAVILFFLVKVLMPAQTIVDPEQYRLDGTLGRITAAITAGGTGEITYSKAGTVRGDAARSINAEPIGRGEEVVILGYQHGVAYVERLERYLHTPAAQIADRLAALNEDQPDSGAGNN